MLAVMLEVTLLGYVVLNVITNGRSHQKPTQTATIFLKHKVNCAVKKERKVKNGWIFAL